MGSKSKKMSNGTKEKVRYKDLKSNKRTTDNIIEEILLKKKKKS